MPVGNMHTRCFWMTNLRLLEAVYALCITLCIAAAPVAVRVSLRRKTTPTDSVQPWTGNDHTCESLQNWYDDQLCTNVSPCCTRNVIELIDRLCDDVNRSQSLTHATDDWLSELRDACRQMGVPADSPELMTLEHEVRLAACPSP